MQHTDKYNFRIIEDTDIFSPETLNKNTEDIEKQLTALDEADAALAQSTANADAALQATAAADKAALEKTAADNKAETDAALAALQTAVGTHGQTCRIKYGTYTGMGKSATVDFKPLVVFVTYAAYGVSYPHVLIRGTLNSDAGETTLKSVTWTNNSVSWTNNSGSGTSQSASTVNYYVVIGVDE